MKFKKMTLFILVTLCSQKAFSQPCGTVYEEYNQGGYSVSLQNNESNANLAGYYWERRTWHGIFRRWSGRDYTADHEIKSAKVEKYCTLELFDQPNFQGFHGCISNGGSQTIDNCSPGPDTDPFSSTRSANIAPPGGNVAIDGNVPNISFVFPPNAAVSIKCTCLSGN